MTNVEELKGLLYRCVRELHYIQSGECTSALCVTSNGKELVEAGMKLLDVRDLAPETLEGSAPHDPD